MFGWSVWDRTASCRFDRRPSGIGDEPLSCVLIFRLTALLHRLLLSSLAGPSSTPSCSHGESVGSFGDVAAWSVCQDKILTTAGDGVMVTTNRTDLWDAMWALKDYGKTHEAVYGREHSPASAGCTSALAPTSASPNCRAPSAASSSSGCRSGPPPAPATPCWLPKPWLIAPPCVCWYKFYAFVKPNALAEGWSRDRILSEIAALGYPAFSGSCSEIYLERCFQEAGLALAERLPVARELGETSLMFLVHPTITPEQMAGYAEAVRSVEKRACR